jgi:hypothetical protein
MWTCADFGEPDAPETCAAYKKCIPPPPGCGGRWKVILVFVNKLCLIGKVADGDDDIISLYQPREINDVKSPWPSELPGQPSVVHINNWNFHGTPSDVIVEKYIGSIKEDSK